MEILFQSGPIEQHECRALVVLALKDGSVLNGTPALAEWLAPFVASGEFGKSLGDHVYLIDPPGVGAKRLLFLNAGKEIKQPDDLRKATARAWKTLREKSFEEMTLSLDGFGDETEVRAAVEGLILMDYQYTALKTDPEKLPNRLKKLTLHTNRDFRDKVERWRAICRGTCLARDVSIMPPNLLNPQKLAEIAVESGQRHGFRTEVMDGQAIREAGMGSMYAVGQGSAFDSRFIIMEYEPARPSGKTFAFVGKAVTFDSGGLSLKPADSMPEMKGDMGGGAAVLGIMSVLRDAGCPHRVVGLVPSVENMPSGAAFRPSDVITSLSGLTIEVKNTDAEGRLILVDALTYADRYRPDYVVDFATLTGACLVALGPKVYAVMGNHQPLMDAIVKAGEEVHERFWPLPLVEDYKDYLKSEVADISNLSSKRWGGAITAGLFLERFAEKYRWAHCDIAAAIIEKKEDYFPEGGNGVGVRMALRMMDLMEKA